MKQFHSLKINKKGNVTVQKIGKNHKVSFPKLEICRSLDDRVKYLKRERGQANRLKKATEIRKSFKYVI